MVLLALVELCEGKAPALDGHEYEEVVDELAVWAEADNSNIDLRSHGLSDATARAFIELLAQIQSASQQEGWPDLDSLRTSPQVQTIITNARCVISAIDIQLSYPSIPSRD